MDFVCVIVMFKSHHQHVPLTLCACSAILLFRRIKRRFPIRSGDTNHGKNGRRGDFLRIASRAVCSVSTPLATRLFSLRPNYANDGKVAHLSTVRRKEATGLVSSAKKPQIQREQPFRLLLEESVEPKYVTMTKRCAAVKHLFRHRSLVLVAAVVPT